MITICRIVMYTLSVDDAEKINRSRELSCLNASPSIGQAHIGNDAAGGMVFPAMVVRVWPWPEGSAEAATEEPLINLQVFLDGNDVYWATSVPEDHSKQGKPGTWTWPARS